MKTDMELYADVVDELENDPALPAVTNIDVKAHDGVITLHGTVRSYWQKWEAADAAKRVYGVHGVVNEITIDFLDAMARADADIERVASNTLFWHSDLPNTITVSVVDGWVTLSGHVDWQFQKDEAKRAVEYLSGVKGISNDVTIKTAPQVDDVRDRIRAGLIRTVDREANAIEIDTTDDGVTLRGQVHSWVDLDAASRAAWSVPGVAFVENDLVVV